MRLSFCLACCAVLALSAAHAWASEGHIAYRARVVHNSRKYLTYVAGRIDLASGDFTEQVEGSYHLNWRVVPSALEPASQTIPSIWRSGADTCQRFAEGLPRMNSPLLRHFIVGQVLTDVMALQAGGQYMSGQLVIHTATLDNDSFEIVASYLGSPLVIVGRLDSTGAVPLVQDLAVLGASEELYQYFIDEITYVPGEPAPDISIPDFNPGDYVTFPEGGSGVTPIRPVKDWLVFQARLPNGRPLNLVFDSGAETMIIDDLVLKVDAQLEPAGDMLVSGAFDDGKMQLYDGFAFEIGGVEFKNLPVAGAMLTSLGYGANLRIHGIVGNEILQLCRLDLDLNDGTLHLSDPQSPPDESGERLALTFIHDLPHIKADLEEKGDAWLLVDTGQQTGLQVNIDFLENYELGDDLVMYGFHSDITGGLRPRYMIEQLDVSLGGATYREHTVDALMESSFDHDGVPVVGSIGFPLLARHFGGITFDYSRQLMYLRDPSEYREFAGRPEAWGEAPALGSSLLANADIVGEAIIAGGEEQSAAAAGDPRANYPWFAQQLALSEQLGDIRSSAPFAPATPGTADSGKEPFALGGRSRVELADRLALFSIAEKLSRDIALTEFDRFLAEEVAEPAEADRPGAEPDAAIEPVPAPDVFRHGRPKLIFDPLTPGGSTYGDPEPTKPAEDGGRAEPAEPAEDGGAAESAEGEAGAAEGEGDAPAEDDGAGGAEGSTGGEAEGG